MRILCATQTDIIAKRYLSAHFAWTWSADEASVASCSMQEVDLCQQSANRETIGCDLQSNAADCTSLSHYWPDASHSLDNPDADVPGHEWVQHVERSSIKR